MLKQKYLIHELAELAQTTIRTIRYYTDEGLLPQPVIESKYAYYDQNHLDRLKLIRRLKDSFLPLSAIRRQMNSLTDEQVREVLLQQAPLDSVNSFKIEKKESTGESKDKSSALEYLSKLMGDRMDARQTGGFHPSQPQPGGVKERQYKYVSPSVPQMVTPLPAETWRKIELAEGVELHLREPVDSFLLRQVEQLMLYAKRIFINQKGGQNEK